MRSQSFLNSATTASVFEVVSGVKFWPCSLIPNTIGPQDLRPPLTRSELGLHSNFSVKCNNRATYCIKCRLEVVSYRYLRGKKPPKWWKNIVRTKTICTMRYFVKMWHSFCKLSFWNRARAASQSLTRLGWWKRSHGCEPWANLNWSFRQDWERASSESVMVYIALPRPDYSFVRWDLFPNQCVSPEQLSLTERMIPTWCTMELLINWANWFFQYHLFCIQ